MGKQADRVVMNSDSSKNIAEIVKVEIAFKDGMRYDPAKLIQSVTGLAGIR